MSKKLRVPKFEYWKSAYGDQWFFHIKSPNGRIVNLPIDSRGNVLRAAAFYKKWGMTLNVVRIDPTTGEVIKDGK
jgi:hypothetical protein